MMQLKEIKESIRNFEEDPLFDLYYSTGLYHEKILKQFDFETIADFRNALIETRDKNYYKLESDPAYLQLLDKRENRKSEIELIKKDTEKTYGWNEERKDEAFFKDIKSQMQPFLDKEITFENFGDDLLKVAIFFFPHLTNSWVVANLSDKSEFLQHLRLNTTLKKVNSTATEDLDLLISKALNYVYYDISKRNYDRLNEAHKTSRYYVKADAYQMLSAYLMALRKAWRHKQYDKDAQSRFQLDLGNGIIATLEIEKLSISKHYNQAYLGSSTLTKPISYSGYENSWYVLSHLLLFYEGFQFKFQFQAYSILTNAANINENASSEIFDDIKKEDEDRYDDDHYGGPSRSIL